MYKFLFEYVLSPFGYIPRTIFSGSYDNSMFCFFEEVSNCFLSGYNILHPRAMYKVSNFSIFSPILVIYLFYNYCISYEGGILLEF